LIVARTFLTGDLLELQVDDEILAVRKSPVSNESELIHELRGTLDSIELTVKRDGQEISVRGHLNPKPTIVDRKGLLFSGILFADSGFRDHLDLETGHDVMIHSVASGSDADGQKLSFYDNIARVNNVPVASLDHLSQLLSVEPSSGEVQLDLRRMVEDSDSGHLFYAERRTIKWSEPEYIGSWDRTLAVTLQSKQ